MPKDLTGKKKQVLNKIPRKSTPGILLSPINHLRLQNKNLNARVQDLEAEAEKLQGIRARFEAQVKSHRAEFQALRREHLLAQSQLGLFESELRAICQEVANSKSRSRHRNHRY